MPRFDQSPVNRENPLMRRATALLLCLAVLPSCASGPTEDEASRIEDYFTRGSQYYAAGRYPQAYDQASRALELDPDAGRVNLLAGRALLMQRTLRGVATALPFLETAADELDTYKADYALAEFHYRYGSLLFDYAVKQRLDLENFPEMTPQTQAEALKTNAEREQTARGHFKDARDLLIDVRLEVPEDLDTLEMLGTCHALLDNDVAAMEALDAALAILSKSREYKNYVLGTDSNLSIPEEGRLRRDLAGDIRREVAIQYLVAGLRQRADDPLAEEIAYDAILALNPKEIPARYSRANVRYDLGRLAEAAADMRTFISTTGLGPESAQVQRAVMILNEFEQLQLGGTSSAFSRQ
jgi:tetratricopeptide (TPR) repeat protein